MPALANPACILYKFLNLEDAKAKIDNFLLYLERNWSGRMTSFENDNFGVG